MIDLHRAWCWFLAKSGCSSGARRRSAVTVAPNRTPASRRAAAQNQCPARSDRQHHVVQTCAFDTPAIKQFSAPKGSNRRSRASAKAQDIRPDPPRAWGRLSGAWLQCLRNLPPPRPRLVEHPAPRDAGPDRPNPSAQPAAADADCDPVRIGRTGCNPQLSPADSADPPLMAALCAVRWRVSVPGEYVLEKGVLAEQDRYPWTSCTWISRPPSSRDNRI